MWGSCICLVGVFIKEQKTVLRMIRYVVLHLSLYFASLISTSIILGVNDDKEKGLFMIHYKDLQCGDINQMNPYHVNNFLPRIHICLQKDIFPKNVYCHNICSFIRNKNQIFFIEEDLYLKKITLKEWDIPIKNLKKALDYKNAMKLMIDLFKGKERNLAGINRKLSENKKFKALVEEMLNEYFLKYYKTFLSLEATEQQKSSKLSLGENSRDDISMTMIIEFLVETEDFEYLFQQVYSDFKKMNKKNKFLECLEPFIITQKIK